MALAELSSFPDIVPIIPDSGLQFLDFGITVSREQPKPSRWGFFAEASWPLGGTDLPVLAEREVAGEAVDDAHAGRRVTCEVELRDIEGRFGYQWMPLTMFRRDRPGSFIRGRSTERRAGIGSGRTCKSRGA